MARNPGVSTSSGCSLDDVEIDASAKCILFEEKKQCQRLVLIGIDPDNSVKEADGYSFGTKDPQGLGPSGSSESPDSNSWGD